MAWTKSIPTDFGVSIEHWEILKVLFDVLQQKAEVSIGGWINSEIKNSGAKPFAQLTVNIPSDTNFALQQEAMQFLESHIQSNVPPFGGES